MAGGLAQKPTIFVALILSNTQTEHTTSGWARGARRSGWAGIKKISCQQNYSTKEKTVKHKVNRFLESIGEMSFQRPRKRKQAMSYVNRQINEVSSQM